MCYNISIFRTKEELELRFKAKFTNPQEYNQYYHVSSFSLPHLPVITNEDPDHIQFYSWGIIPPWIKNRDEAEKIRVKRILIYFCFVVLITAVIVFIQLIKDFLKV